MPPAVRTRPSLDATLDVETPEQVVVSYTLAGIGTRGAAALIELLHRRPRAGAFAMLAAPPTLAAQGPIMILELADFRIDRKSVV